MPARRSKVCKHILPSSLPYLFVFIFTACLVGQETQPNPPLPPIPSGGGDPEDYCDPVDYLIDSLKPLSAIDFEAAFLPAEHQPQDCAGQMQSDKSNQPYAATGKRFEKDLLVQWESSKLAHRPLYFEDVPLERYGQGYSPLFQPVVSGSKFIFSAASLPYRMTLDPPRSYFYTLGYERPGNWAPSVVEQLPWNWRAAFVQAGAITGGVLMFP